MADGAQLVLVKRGEGCGRLRVVQGVDQVAGSALSVVGEICLGHGAIVGGGGFNGLGDAFGGRGQYVDAVAVIVLGVCANLSAVDSVTGPSTSDSRGFMEYDTLTG